MRRFFTLKIVIGVFFVIALIVAAYFYFAENVNAPIQEENTTSTTPQTLSDALPEGVSVIEKNGERVLRDERVGYEMKVLDGVEVKGRSDGILFYTNTDTPGYSLTFGGLTIFNRDGLSLEDWVARLHSKTPFIFYDERERIDKGNLQIIKIRVDGPGEPYEYFFPFKDKIIGVSFLADKQFDSYIQNIKFFE